ncbi:reverse transcriptase domain-containing protein [Tanacetum coccineum]
MFDENFLTSIFNGLPRDDFDDNNDPKTHDQDRIGDHWPIHDSNIKWKLMRPHLGERFEGPEQLKWALAFYALANGYKLYYEVNNPMRLVAKCSKDNQEKKCQFRTFEYGSLITSNWIARNYAKKIMINPTIKVRDIVALILKKYKCKVSILNSNEGSSCNLGVESMPDGRDGNNQIYPITWAVVNVENKENWSWFMQCLSDDLGIVNSKGLTIISDQHKGIIKAAKKSEISSKKHTNILWKEILKAEIAYLRTNKACDAFENGITIYFKHKDPEEYVLEWYTNERFVSSYNHCIEGMNGMDQWPITSYQKPLPPIKRRMPGRPLHKRKRDVLENDGNRTRISRKGQVNHCTLCGETRHNQRACPSKGLEGSASAGVNTPTMSARGEKRSRKGGKTPSVSLRGGGKKVSTPSSPSVGFKMSTTSASAGVRVTGSVVSSRGRGDGSKSKMYPDGIRPIGYGVSWDLIDGETMLGLQDSMGLLRPPWPAGITPKDVRIHAQQSLPKAIIPFSESQPLPSQDEELAGFLRKVDSKLNVDADNIFVGSSFLDQEIQEVESDLEYMSNDEIMFVSGNEKEDDNSEKLSQADEIAADNVIDELVSMANTEDATTNVLATSNLHVSITRLDFFSAQVNNVAKNLPTKLKHNFDSIASVIPKIVFDAIAQQLPDFLTAMLKDTLPQALISVVRDTLPDFRKQIQKSIKKKIPKVTKVEKTATNLHELVRFVSQLVRIVDSVAPPIHAEVKAQEEELAAYEAKRAKMMEEYNHCITFGDYPLPITKFSYRVNNSIKEATMRITRNNQPLNLKIYDKFVLKKLGFTEWLELHALLSMLYYPELRALLR